MKGKRLKDMSKRQRYLIYDFFIAYFSMGLYLILIGSALPSIKADYGISYRIGGLMMSAQQIGYLVTGVCVSMIAQRLSVKAVYLGFGILAFVGLALMMVTGNPFVLLFAMLLTGICKGSTCNFGNQLVSTMSGSNASLLNLAQAFFAVGACAAPLVAMVCGTSWRLAFAITIAVGIVMFLHGMRVEIRPEDSVSNEDSGTVDFGFFRTKIFWLCAALIMSYLAIEGSVMGWLVTYFVDSGVAKESTAQLLATALWGALLVGRFASAWLSTRFRPHHMIAVMSLGVAVCFTGLMMSHTLVPMTVSAIGLGLFMAGMYGTALGGSENLMEKYPMCMGMFIAIPGIGAALTQSAIGTIADHIGIRGGMCFLYVLVAVLLVAAALFFVYHQKKTVK
ncbi:MFS transporter [Butyricicoccus porcorum]|uniref:MFS transporter n=1 Tax=Butyricicoccus porcorum TaxID=1945634 RepID=UPI003F4AEDAE